ncbi:MULTISPECIES: MurR/RpiR family transcriptional regulator [Peptoniphilus]|uniref:MurR/RpiR family transcriptional regulator n=1 Tax=Peptoniphilus TaxID=162289 RepID=UPI0015590F0C|nr:MULTISPECIES: MurR/RpiR family transcriptional regulator [Peptoniphilus]
MNILQRINYFKENFSKTQLKIGDFILENFDKTVFYTSTELAYKCGVSESSVVRFANFIQYKGYSDMQNDLQNFLREKITMTQRLHNLTEKKGNQTQILYDVLQKGKDDIQWLIDNINPNTFDEIVDIISTAKKVYLVGSRSSYSVTYFLGLSLKWIRNNVYIIDGINRDFDDISEITSKDVLISLSLPRYLKSTLNIHRYAYNRGVKTICITDSITSPLVKYTTIPLLINNEILSFSDNLIPVITIVTALLNSIAAKEKKAEQKMAKKEAFWNDFELYQKF